MANDYWNRGRRQEGFQQSSSLDTLERLLGIGQGVASKIQSSRDKRSDAYKVRMAGILDSGQNKEPLHRRTFDNNIIEGLKDTFIKTMGDGINSTNLETKELYNTYVRQFDEAKQLNNEYNAERPWFANAENEFLDLVINFRDVQGTDLSPAKRRQMMGDIEKKLNEYTKKKTAFEQKYGAKIAYDPEVTNDMASMTFTSKKFLTLAKGSELGETAFITDRAFDLLNTGLTSDDPTIASRAVVDYDNFSASIDRTELGAADRGIAESTVELKEAVRLKDKYYEENVSDGQWREEGDKGAYVDLVNKEAVARAGLDKYYNDYYTVSADFHVEDPRRRGNIKKYKNQLMADMSQVDFSNKDEAIKYINEYKGLPESIAKDIKNQAIIVLSNQPDID